MLTGTVEFLARMRNVIHRSHPHTIITIETDYPGFEKVELAVQLALDEEDSLRLQLKKLAIQYAYEHKIAKWAGSPLKIDVLFRYQYLIAMESNIIPTFGKLAHIEVAIANRDGYTPADEKKLMSKAKQLLAEVGRRMFIDASSLFYMATNMIPNPYRGDKPITEVIEITMRSIVEGMKDAHRQIETD